MAKGLVNLVLADALPEWRGCALAVQAQSLFQAREAGVCKIDL